MKKALTVILVISVLASCASQPAVSDDEMADIPPIVSSSPTAVSLDAGIAVIGDEIQEALPKGTRIAVMSLDSPSAKLSSYVLDELQAGF